MVVIDQLTKAAAVQYLAPADASSIPLWNGVLELTYVENHGIAWGMLQNQRWIVTIATSVMLLFVLFALIKRWFANSRLATAGLVLILAGGIGNLIDEDAPVEDCTTMHPRKERKKYNGPVMGGM